MRSAEPTPDPPTLHRLAKVGPQILVLLSVVLVGAPVVVSLVMWALGGFDGRGPFSMDEVADRQHGGMTMVGPGSALVLEAFTCPLAVVLVVVAIGVELVRRARERFRR